MMKSITMTPAQTSIYDAGGDDARELLLELRADARYLAAQTLEASSAQSCTVEVYTADGIVVSAVDVSRCCVEGGAL
jgi:hypothetical protein